MTKYKLNQIYVQFHVNNNHIRNKTLFIYNMLAKTYLYRKKLQIKAITCDDPGGHRSKLDKLYNKSCRLRASDIRIMFFRKTDRVYDLEIILKSNNMYYLKILPDMVFPEKNPGDYMKRLEIITDKINKWNVSDKVRNIIENLPDEAIRNELIFDLGICDKRLNEFE